MKKILLLFISLILICMPAFSAKINKTEKQSSKFSFFQTYKEIDNKIWEINKLKSEQAKLSKSERDTVSKYVFGAVKGEDTFLLINAYYMGTLTKYVPKKEITKPLQYRLEYYAKALNAVVSKTRLKQNIMLYAGIDERDMMANFSDKDIQKSLKMPANEENTEILDDKLTNKTYCQKGFLKAYYSDSYVHKAKYRLKIKAPKNLQALLLQGIGKAGAKEMLINKGQEWKILGVENGVDRITKEDYYLITVKQK